jgi:hypothetical protein
MGVLTKEEVIDRMEILEDGQIQVRKSIRVLEDGVILSQTFHRHVVEPDSDISAQDQKVKDICAVVHTEAVKTAFISKKVEKAGNLDDKIKGK